MDGQTPITEHLELHIRKGKYYPATTTTTPALYRQGTPPGFWKGVAWRACVKLCPLNIRKLRG